MDLKFAFLNGARTDKNVDFNDVHVINLGAREDNDMVFNLPSDIGISPYHAQIRQVDDKIFIQDMGSSEGTFLNGQRISKTQLSEINTVQLGLSGPKFQINATIGKVRLSTQTSSGQPKIYGQRTVGMMIQQALRSAGTGVSRSTSYFEALLENRLKISTRKYRIAVIVIFAMLSIMAGILSVYIYQVNTRPDVKLLANEADAAEQIARQNRHNIFLLAGLPKDMPSDSDGWQGFCTAFAIGPNLLATNAHCVEKAEHEYQSVWALMNEDSKSKFEIKKMVRHKEYAPGAITPDVAILEISDVLKSWVVMAATPQLKAIEAGSFIYLYGFPGRLSNLAEPVATFIRGEIGRVTTLKHSVGAFENNVLLQHSAIISEGTSGSPMFNLEGAVVGINAGGYASDGHIMTGYNFGIRIDMVAPLLQLVDTSTVR